MNLNRRNFLIGAGLAGGALLAPSLKDKAYDYWMDLKYKSDKKILHETALDISNINKNTIAAERIYLGNANTVDRLYRDVDVLYGPAPDGEPKAIVPPHVDSFFNKNKNDIRIVYTDSISEIISEEDLTYIGQSIKKELGALFDINIDIKYRKIQETKHVYNREMSNLERERDLSDTSLDSSSFEYLKYKYIIILDSDKSLGTSYTNTNIAIVELNKTNFEYSKIYKDMNITEKEYKDATLNLIKKLALHETAHKFFLPHCWEENCIMSYRHTQPEYTILEGINAVKDNVSFGPRCKIIAKSISNGKIKITDEKKSVNPEKPELLAPRVALESAKVVSDYEAKNDLSKHLIKYLIERTKFKELEDIETEVRLGVDEDTVIFSKDYAGVKKVLAEAKIKDQITDFTIF